MSTTHRLPDGLNERSPAWHRHRFVEFVAAKLAVGEPSPHLRMVLRSCDGVTRREAVWRLACYAVPYSFAVGQALWLAVPFDPTGGFEPVEQFVRANWSWLRRGIRRERRCVRALEPFLKCLHAVWQAIADGVFDRVTDELARAPTSAAGYEVAWRAVTGLPFFGRYISIRFIEGLRRLYRWPIELPDIRAVGAWSPRRCLVYIYPDQAPALLTESRECSVLSNEIAEKFFQVVRADVPGCDRYVYAAMLCEYRDAFEDRAQYVGWTLDQELEFAAKAPQLLNAAFYAVRRAVFPVECLGEEAGWSARRWDVARLLRDEGVVWTDLKYDYKRCNFTDSGAVLVERDYTASALSAWPNPVLAD